MQTNPVTLPDGHSLRRLPRHATLPRRSPAFFEQFDDRVLYYDCFRTSDGAVGLIGPNPMNLLVLLERARFTAMPEGIPVDVRHYTGEPSRVPTLYTLLSGVPATSTHLEIRIEDLSLSVAIGPDISARLAGRRVMTTMNRDNPLEWVEDWCRWHSVMHGIDAVVLFDNASQTYGPTALREAALRGLRDGVGAPEVIVVEWPFRFGPYDPGVVFRPYWAVMSQQASMLLSLRKYARYAEMLLNCDVDELVGGIDIFDALQHTVEGALRLKGRWILPTASHLSAIPVGHLAYGNTHRNPLKSFCSDKWAIHPTASQSENPELVLKFHRVVGMKSEADPKHPFYHFKAISTGWKDQTRIKRRTLSHMQKSHEPLARDREIFMQRWSSLRSGADLSGA